MHWVFRHFIPHLILLGALSTSRRRKCTSMYTLNTIIILIADIKISLALLVRTHVKLCHWHLRISNDKMSAFVCLVYIFHDFNFTGSQCQVLEFSNPSWKIFFTCLDCFYAMGSRVCVCARERKKQKLTIPIKSPISLITRETHSSSYARSCHGDTSLKGHYYYCYWSARATDAMLWLRVRQRRNVLRLPFYSCSVRRGTKTAHADLPDTQTIDRQSWAYEGSRVEAASRLALVTMGGSRLELVKVETFFKIYCLPSFRKL